MPENLQLILYGGVSVLEDDGDPYNNMSQLRRADGSVVVFEHPTGLLEISADDPATLIINMTESLGAANFVVNDFGIPLQAIQVQQLETSGRVTLYADGSISEVADADPDADIVAGELVLAAGTGIGSAANALETLVATLEARTFTGGIYLTNLGALAVDDLDPFVEGARVIDTGDVRLTSYGTMQLGVGGPNQTVRSGQNGGSIDLRAIGYDSDIIQTGARSPLHAQAGSIQLSAGRDIIFDTAASNGSIIGFQGMAFEAGRDFTLGGNFVLQSIISSDIAITAGRNISFTAGGGAASQRDLLLTTGPGGTIAQAGSFGLFADEDISMTADRMMISSIVAGSSSVTVSPVTPGRQINLGSGSDVLTALELSDAELDLIAVGPGGLTIGGDAAGRIVLTGAIDPEQLGFSGRTLTLHSGTVIDHRGSLFLTGDLTLRAGDNVTMSSGATIDADGLAVFVDTPNADAGIGGRTAMNGAIVTTATTMTGNADNDDLYAAIFGSNLFGLGGNDILIGSNEGEMLDGGTGTDSMSGGDGDDIYFVDNAGDGVNEAAGRGFDTVFASVSHTLTPEVERVFALNPAGTAQLNFTGNALNNELGGTAGANILDGGTGADLMVGGDGDDVYFVDNVGDVVSDSPTGGYDTVFSSISFTLTTRIERVVALDPSATTALNFTGNANANEISGNAGGNMIDGGGGVDILFGLGGGDAFVFASALGGGNVDALPDFQVGTDRIYLDDAIFSTLTPGALPAGAFRTGAAAADADDRIIYNSVTGALLYDGDGNGVGAAVQFATLHEGLAVTASDFQVI